MLHHVFHSKESVMDDFDDEGFNLHICQFTHASYVVVIVFNN